MASPKLVDLAQRDVSTNDTTMAKVAVHRDTVQVKNSVTEFFVNKAQYMSVMTAHHTFPAPQFAKALKHKALRPVGTITVAPGAGEDNGAMVCCVLARFSL